MTGGVKLGRDKVQLKASAGVLVLYKSQFGCDYIEDSKAILDDDKKLDIEQYIQTGYRLLWCMAKMADPDILPPDEWAESLGEFDLEEPLKKAQKLYSESLNFAQKIQNATEDSEELTAEKLIAYSALCGMTIADLDRLPLPMVLESIYEYVRLKYGEGEERAATQADYDNF